MHICEDNVLLKRLKLLSKYSRFINEHAQNFQIDLKVNLQQKNA